jgi:hypothetical protein
MQLTYLLFIIVSCEMSHVSCTIIIHTFYNKIDAKIIFTIIIHSFFFTFTKKKEVKIISTSNLLYKVCKIVVQKTLLT